jgi:hypothetical protein
MTVRWKERNAHIILIRFLVGSDCFGDIGRWKDNTKMDPKELGCEGMDWTQFSRERGPSWTVMNTLLCFLVP